MAPAGAPGTLGHGEALRPFLTDPTRGMTMRWTRRRLLAAGLGVPAILVARRGADALGDVVTAAIRGARPAADGTSATRCAQCGSPGHTMLDPGCPLAPRVLA